MGVSASAQKDPSNITMAGPQPWHILKRKDRRTSDNRKTLQDQQVPANLDVEGFGELDIRLPSTCLGTSAVQLAVAMSHLSVRSANDLPFTCTITITFWLWQQHCTLHA
jgi:hypothetical protein